ncbi:hypothetical protein ACFLUJ_07910 [Chloroflexota bacterium]
MDWGIVASVLVANLLLVLGILLFAGFVIFLIVSGIKKKTKATVSVNNKSIDQEPVDVVRRCSMTFCPMNKVVK